MLDEVLNGSLKSAAAAIAAGDIAPRELVAAAVDRIAGSPGARASFLRPDFDEAMDAAARLPAGAEETAGPLRGIPLAHKDLFSRSGRVSSFAAHPLFHRIGTGTADALLGLDRAGAVDLGALHMSEFAMGPAGWSEHFGFIENPVSPRHVSGGSSSGSAAAVARKAIFGSLGTDTGGSIRIPAAFCAVVGFKPTNGLVSVRGVHPVSAALDTVGPLARSVEDAALMLDALVDGNDGRRGGVPSYASALAGPESGLRVGWVHPSSLPVPLDPAVSDAYEKSAGLMKASGCVVEEVHIEDWALLNALTGIVFMSEAAAVHLSNLDRDGARIGGQVRERLQQGLHFPASLYLSALRQREMRLSRLRESVFSRVDVVLCPTTPCLAPERSVYDGLAGAGEAIAFNARVGAYTGIFNYFGLPAISVPVGRPEGGPVAGMQLAGDMFREPTVLRAASILERACSL